MDDNDISNQSRGRLEQTTGAKKAAWQQTLEDMEEIARDRREDGWEVVTVRASHTDTVTPEMGDHDDFGLFHVLPKSDRQNFLQAYEEGEYTEFLFYGRTIAHNVFGATELLDPENRRSILIASQYALDRARGLSEVAQEEGRLFTHIKELDGTILASFEHAEDYQVLLGET